MAIRYQSQRLFDSPLARIVDIRWRATESRPAEEHRSPLAEITFQRRGMFAKRQGPHGIICDPNTLLFIDAHEPYQMTHPADLDCACTALLIDRSVLADIVHRFAPAVRETNGRLLSFHDAPASPDLVLSQYRLLAAAAAQAEPLVVEEEALGLARGAVQAGLRFHARRRPVLRPGTLREHTDRVQAVKTVLAARFSGRLSLQALADEVCCAPAHLCWVFKQQTGTAIHQYLTRLRLAAAMERLMEDDISLSCLACRLGFAHHSHFTTAFRREFGYTPSQARRRLRAAEARHFRKILQAGGRPATVG